MFWSIGTMQESHGEEPDIACRCPSSMRGSETSWGRGVRGDALRESLGSSETEQQELFLIIERVGWGL
eukprot:6240983-Pyramimonas_sp.AAC.1